MSGMEFGRTDPLPPLVWSTIIVVGGLPMNPILVWKGETPANLVRTFFKPQCEDCNGPRPLRAPSPIPQWWVWLPSRVSWGIRGSCLHNGDYTSQSPHGSNGETLDDFELALFRLQFEDCKLDPPLGVVPPPGHTMWWDELVA